MFLASFARKALKVLLQLRHGQGVLCQRVVDFRALPQVAQDRHEFVAAEPLDQELDHQ